MRKIGHAAGAAAADPSHGSWPPRLAKVRVKRVSKGTGWAIGATGIITTRDVVAPLLPEAVPAGGASLAGQSAEIVIGAGPDRSFDASVIWDSAASGLAVLAIAERNRATWTTLLRSTPATMLARPPAPPTDPATVIGLPGRPGGSETSTLAWMLTAPEQVTGALQMVYGSASRAHLDAPRHTLSRTARRHGLPGGIVTAIADPGATAVPALIGLVTAGPKGRRSPRLEIALLPDPTTDTGFAAALEQVGARPVVFNMDGPTLQQFLTTSSLDPALYPRRVRDTTDLGWYGTKLARTDIAEAADPYFGWVSRPERQSLSTKIDRALAGDGPRIIVLHGPSAAGKSRLAAEVIRSHAGLRDHALITPRRDRSILDMPRRLLPEGCVVFVDNIQDYPATALTHERTRVLLQERPDIMVVATVLDLPEVTGGTRLVDSGQARREEADPADEAGPDFPLATASLSGVHTVLDDDILTIAMTVGAAPVWARAGGSSSRSDWAIARARKQGLGLGEYLAGYHDLVDHYTAATWPTRALVNLVADWGRSGIGEALPVALARRLWEQLVPAQLPRDELRAFTVMTPIEREKLWRGALRYACDDVLGCTSLIVEDAENLVASEFSRVHIDQGAISGQLWEYLISAHPATPAQRVDLGLAALESGAPRRALRAFESVLYFRDSDRLTAEQRAPIEVIARRGIAIYHARTGRDEQAIMVYTDLVDSFGASDDPDVGEQVAQALLGIGLTFSKLGSHGQAMSAYTELATRYRDHPSPILSEYVAKALLGQATTAAIMGRTDEEASAYADILARCSQDPALAVQEIVAIARAAVDRAQQRR